MNGMKYIGGATVLLFTSVFLLTRCSSPNENATETTTEVAGTTVETSVESTSAESTTTEDTTTADSTTTADGLSISTDEYTTLEETVLDDVIFTEASDPKEADNTWAMYLINEKNPLPDEFEDFINLKYVDETWREYYMEERMADFYITMKQAAENDGIELLTVSTYRTFEYQANNFESSKENYIAQGYSEDEAYELAKEAVQLPHMSEHNAGLAVDILSNEYDSLDEGFEDTNAFAWLEKHAAEYGFILRYPEGKKDTTGITYEPWHYRFVGVYYANEIKESGLSMEEYFAEKGWLDEDGVAISHTLETQDTDFAKYLEENSVEEETEETEEITEEDTEDITENW